MDKYRHKQKPLTVFYAKYDVPEIVPGLLFRQGMICGDLQHFATLHQLKCWNNRIIHFFWISICRIYFSVAGRRVDDLPSASDKIRFSRATYRDTNCLPPDHPIPRPISRCSDVLTSSRLRFPCTPSPAANPWKACLESFDSGPSCRRRQLSSGAFS